jgi:ATPase subunit of ABC transporter with duplicated ATPase domains
MFQVNNFSFNYPDSDNFIIKDWYFNSEKESKTILLGSNGVGKSTILKAVFLQSFEKGQKIKMPLEKVYITQEIPEFLDINPQNPKNSIYEILYQIFSEQIDFDILMTWLTDVLDYIPADFSSRLQQNLFEMELAPGFLSNKFELLSPGTKKKLILSIAFASNPKVILADELTNHLDKQAILVLIDWIKKSSASMLIVDHNQEFLANFQNFLFLPNNKDRKMLNLPNMSFEEVVIYLDELETRQKLELVNSQRKLIKLQTAQEEYRRQAVVFNSKTGPKIRAVEKRIKREITDNPVMSELDLRKRVIFANNSQNSKAKKDLILEIQDLKFKIGENKIQTISDFKLYNGQKLRLTGANGRGKSSLLKMIRELLNYKDITKNSQYISGKIEYFNFTRDEFLVFKQLTNYQTQHSIASYLELYTKMMPFEYDRFLKKIELAKFKAVDNLGHLSMGETIRLQLGVLALKAQNLKLLILDEPGNFLDIFTQEALIKLLHSYKSSLILVTHDEILANKIGFTDTFELN